MEKDNSFSMLLASSGHDMKNVIAAVMESIDWLQNDIDQLSVEQNQEFKKIIEMLSIINNELMQILCLYKFENKQYSLQNKEQDLEEFLDFQISYLKPLFTAKNLLISWQCTVSEMRVFDEVMLSSAVRNAVLNALKFAKHKVIVSADIVDDLLVISINDDGPGYPLDMLGRVSDKMQSKVDFNSHSTGLGLHFAEHVASLHTQGNKKGYIELSNDSSLSGAKFSIVLP